MSNLAAVTTHIEGLRAGGQLDTAGEALAAIALTLAAQLDVADPPTMTASWARELRTTLGELGKGHDDSDADSWLDGMSAEVRDTAKF
jgi:hypothetical protein